MIVGGKLPYISNELLSEIQGFLVSSNLAEFFEPAFEISYSAHFNSQTKKYFKNSWWKVLGVHAPHMGHGVDLAAQGVVGDNALKVVKKSIDFCRYIKSGKLIVHPGQVITFPRIVEDRVIATEWFMKKPYPDAEGVQSRASAFSNFLSRLKVLNDYASSKGVEILVENMPGPKGRKLGNCLGVVPKEFERMHEECGNHMVLDIEHAMFSSRIKKFIELDIIRYVHVCQKGHSPTYEKGPVRFDLLKKIHGIENIPVICEVNDVIGQLKSIVHIRELLSS